MHAKKLKKLGGLLALMVVLRWIGMGVEVELQISGENP